MLSKFASIIIIIIIVLRQSHMSPSPIPKSVFKTCYDSNRLCFETDLSTKLDPSTFALGLDNLCSPGKTLPQIYGEVEQKALQEYLETLPKYVKYLAPIGLKIKYRQWTEVIKVIKTDSLSSKNYLMMKLDKNSIVLQAEDGDAKHTFGCVTKGSCPCQSSPKTKDPLCLQLDTCCLQINNNNNKLTYYEAINYCNIQSNASLLTYSTLSSNQKVLTSLLPNVQELWAGETRVSLNWMNKNNEPAIYTHWQPGYPKHKAVFAYLKYDDKGGGWMTFQDVDLSSDDDDDAEKKYIAVCVGEEKPSGVEKPSGKTNPDNNISNSNNSNSNNNNNNDNDDSNNSFKFLKIGLGLGLSLCLLLVSVLVKVLVVCLRYRKRRRNEFKGHLGKTPSNGTVSSSASTTESRRAGNYHLSEYSYNNYVTRDNFSNFNNGTRSKPLDSCLGHPGYPEGKPVPPSNDNNNRIYEDIRPYEIPDGAPIVEHIYKAIRNLPVEYQRQLPQLPPERSETLPQAPPQPQYLQMRRNSYMEVIG